VLPNGVTWLQQHNVLCTMACCICGRHPCTAWCSPSKNRLTQALRDALHTSPDHLQCPPACTQAAGGAACVRLCRVCVHTPVRALTQRRAGAAVQWYGVQLYHGVAGCKLGMDSVVAGPGV
jgi:hypothetical protein